MIVSSTGASLALLNTKKIKDDKQRRVAFRLDGQRPTKYVLPSDSEENKVLSGWIYDGLLAVLRRTVKKPSWYYI